MKVWSLPILKVALQIPNFCAFSKQTSRGLKHMKNGYTELFFPKGHHHLSSGLGKVKGRKSKAEGELHSVTNLFPTLKVQFRNKR